jgi:MoaA/NifB/PqqE/SkfB family radical SAM enzyme
VIGRREPAELDDQSRARLADPLARGPRRPPSPRGVRRDRPAHAAAGAGVRRPRPRARPRPRRRRAWAIRRATPDVDDAPLAAPLEAHLQLTNRCAAGCAGCYTGASAAAGAGEWGLAEWSRAIDALADAGVFHVALGGGESATLPWLGALVEHARARGVVPNLTTSGLAGLDRLLPIADRFGQINVSIDGLGATYAAVRGFDGFARADAAVRALRAVTRHVGINVVVTRANFDELPALFAYARRRRLTEVELLRFKPSGRGAARLRAPALHRRPAPRALADGAGRDAPPPRAGQARLLVHADDRAPRSGAAAAGRARGLRLRGRRLPDRRQADRRDHRVQLRRAAAARRRPAHGHRPARVLDPPDAFGRFRTWRDAAEPCRSCRYLTQCRGGCRVVSAHAGDLGAPDPECPRVVDFLNGRVAFGNEGRAGSAVGLPVV